MSNIVATTIDIHYPVAGVDNDSKGFRDNFARIQTALAQAKAELEQFETRAVLKTPLAGAGVSTNDLAAGIILNGRYNKFYATSYSATITGTSVDVSLWNGEFQKFTLTQNTSLTFSHWPVTGLYGIIRLHLIAGTSNTVAITLGTAQGGNVIEETGFPVLEIDNVAFQSIEAFSYDGGANVFYRYLGRYELPTG
jgi:hypothetical protein